MSTRVYRFLQAVLILGLFLFLMVKVINNQLTWYINLRFVTLTIIGIVFLVILAVRLFQEGVQLRKETHTHEEHHHDHDHSPSAMNLWIMLIPLLIGILIPAKPLDSNAVSAKGLTTSSPLVSSDSSSRLFETPSEQRTVLDWVKLFYIEKDLTPYIGQLASVVGFVYFDENLPAGQFFVSRFVLSCCAADGYAVGVIVKASETGSLKPDQWVQVKGPVDAVSYGDRTSPIIQAESVTIVEQPDQPYLYP